MKMGFTFTEAKRLTFGKWSEFFEEFKNIHNIEATQTTFVLPRKIEETSKGLKYDEEIED